MATSPGAPSHLLTNNSCAIIWNARGGRNNRRGRRSRRKSWRERRPNTGKPTGGWWGAIWTTLDECPIEERLRSDWHERSTRRTGGPNGRARHPVSGGRGRVREALYQKGPGPLEWQPVARRQGPGHPSQYAQPQNLHLQARPSPSPPLSALALQPLPRAKKGGAQSAPPDPS